VKRMKEEDVFETLSGSGMHNGAPHCGAQHGGGLVCRVALRDLALDVLVSSHPVVLLLLLSSSFLLLQVASGNAHVLRRVIQRCTVPPQGGSESSPGDSIKT